MAPFVLRNEVAMGPRVSAAPDRQALRIFASCGDPWGGVSMLREHR